MEGISIDSLVEMSKETAMNFHYLSLKDCLWNQI